MKFYNIAVMLDQAMKLLEEADIDLDRQEGGATGWYQREDKLRKQYQEMKEQEAKQSQRS